MNRIKPQKRQKSRGSNRRGQGSRAAHPPQIGNYGLTRDVRMRFVSNAAVNQAISFQNLLDTVLVATTTTAGTDLFNAVKVKSVECWSLPAIGTASTVSVTYDSFTAGAAGDQILHTDTSMGIEPAHVIAKPAPQSLAGLFQFSAATTAFLLECPTGTVVDVHMSLRNAIMGAATAAQNALVGAAAGVIYFRGLDGKATATTLLPPVGTATVQ